MSVRASNILQVLFVIALGQAVRSALVWNTGGLLGLFISIAIPIDLPTRPVFMSYNFEANYRLPKNWHKNPQILRGGNDTHLDPNDDPLADFEDYSDDYAENRPIKPKRKKPKHKTKKKPKRKPKPKPAVEDYKDFFEGYPDGVEGRRDEESQSLLSRTKFYQMLSQRFEQHGFGCGDSCLLRLICEANSARLGELNGVLGSLMHVMFSPSSSRNEALPQRYSRAERNGQRDNCDGYSVKCERSLLDLITGPIKTLF